MMPECWQWIIELTETYLVHIQYEEIKESKYIQNRITGTCFYICDIFKPKHINDLQSIIYQAIDGVNETDYIHFDSKAHGLRIEIITNDELFENYFHYSDYPSKTLARLAALEWIYEQIKGESKTEILRQFHAKITSSQKDINDSLNEIEPIDNKKIPTEIHEANIENLNTLKPLDDNDMIIDDPVMSDLPVIGTIKVKPGKLTPLEPPDLSDIVNKLKG